MPLSFTCPSCDATLRVKEDHAGKRTKCPRCGAVVTVPAESPAEEFSFAAHAKASTQTKECPKCGKRVLLGAKRCRFCGANVEEKREVEKEEPVQRRPRFKPCPKCGARGAKRVKWTAWGSFYGPALFKHVRCPDCGHGYNGKTGRSNLIPAILCVVIPLAGIAAIVVYILMVLKDRNWL